MEVKNYYGPFEGEYSCMYACMYMYIYIIQIHEEMNIYI